MKIQLYVVHILVKIISFRLHHKFEKSLSSPQIAQENLLLKIQKLANRQALPHSPSTYTDYTETVSWTSERVEFYETTSGSSGLKKNIPYTKSLLRSFQNMFLLWASDILSNYRIKNGVSFISISPQIQSLGMSSDVEYLSPILQKVINHFLITRPGDFRAKDGDTFLEVIAKRLLCRPDLEVISIWSPTYFLVILDWIYTNHDSLDYLSLQQKNNIYNKNWQNLWPKLHFVSCWADAGSSQSFHKLQESFPNATFQPKGLLSTECPVTVPWTKAGGAVPLWDEVYLEFINSEGKILPLYQMAIGEIGEILVSSQGGILRYNLGDKVQCTQYYKKSPVIKFLGRSGEVSDLVGEKLDSISVEKALSNLSQMQWTLVPFKDRYVFISDSAVSAAEVDSRLRHIYHYALSRELGQLKQVETKVFKNLHTAHTSYCQMRGQKLGDIKMKFLWTDSGFLQHIESLKLVQPSV